MGGLWLVFDNDIWVDGLERKREGLVALVVVARSWQ